MSLPHIDVAKAKRLVASGALLVDIRESDEYSRESIPGATNSPLSELAPRSLGKEGGLVLFHCRAGSRTAANAQALAGAARCEAMIVDGGIEAWKAAGLAVASRKSAPIEIMRQVQIAAGSAVLLGVLLGAFVSPLLAALPAAIGAGLVFSGVSGTCMLGTMLRRMPWNQTSSVQTVSP